MATAQHVGELDVLLRAMEDDARPSDLPSAPCVDQLLAVHYQQLLSNAWVSQAHAVFFAVKQAGERPDEPDWRGTEADIKRVRVGLEKHQIADDRGMVLQLESHPPSAAEPFIYDGSDKRRQHIMPTGLMPSGAMAWHVIDAPNGRSYWLNRRQLSERVLAAWTRLGQSSPA